MKICKYCGQQQEGNNGFCYNCGAKLEEVQPVEESKVEVPVNPQPTPIMNYQTTTNSKSGNKVLPIIIGLFIIILAFFILKPILFNKNTSTNNNNVINDNNTIEKKVETAKYKVGDAVTLVDGSKWHVMNISEESVTLLLDELVVEHSGYSNVGGDEFHQKYENSYVKEYIEQTYLPSLKSSLESNGGDTTNLKARLITAQEYLNLAGHELDSTKNQSKPSSNRTEEQKRNDSWLSMTDNYWTMTNVKEIDPNHYTYGAYSVFVLLDSKLWTDGDASDSSWYLHNTASGIRPVIETTTKNIK